MSSQFSDSLFLSHLGSSLQGCIFLFTYLRCLFLLVSGTEKQYLPDCISLFSLCVALSLLQALRISRHFNSINCQFACFQSFSFLLRLSSYTFFLACSLSDLKFEILFIFELTFSNKFNLKQKFSNHWVLELLTVFIFWTFEYL